MACTPAPRFWVRWVAPPCWREAVSGPSWPPLPSPVPHGLGAGPGHRDPPCAQGCLCLCPVWGSVSTCPQWVPRAPSPDPQLQAHRGRGETLLTVSWSGNSRSAPLSERRELPCLLRPGCGAEQPGCGVLGRLEGRALRCPSSLPACCLPHLCVLPLTYTEPPGSRGRIPGLQNWKPGRWG